MPVANSQNKANWQSGIWLPFAGSLHSLTFLKPSQIELASGSRLPVANSQEFANWQLTAVCLSLFSFNCLKPSQIEMASGCPLPVAKSK